MEKELMYAHSFIISVVPKPCASPEIKTKGHLRRMGREKWIINANHSLR